MARSRGFGLAPRRGPRRRTAWALGPQTTTDGGAQAITTSSSVLATGGGTVSLAGLTLVRLRGDLNVFLTAADAVNGGYHGAFGIGIVKSEVFAAGITSMPTPLTSEAENVWLYHRYFSILAAGIIGGAAMSDSEAVHSTSAALHIEVDSKAMRKLAIGETFFAAVEVVEIGTAGMMFAFNSRVLVKLL